MLTTTELIAATDAIVYPSHPGRTAAATVREEYNTALLEYRQSYRDLENQWALWLADEHLDNGVPIEVADALYRQAWEDGHSSGYNEVENRYQELANLVNLAVRAARA